MPPRPAESLVAIDGSAALEGRETESRLGQVAQRLNRLSVLRAAFRSVATALLSASLLAACAAFLDPIAFRVALAALSALTVLVIALSVRGVRKRWATPLEAARWVEHKIPLDQRLLTLVADRGRDSGAALWPELEADNLAQLGRWSRERLGIAALPANVVLLLLAVIAAWLFLVPWAAETTSPLEVPGGSIAAQQKQQDPAEGDGGGVASKPISPEPQSPLQNGARPSTDGAGPQNRVEGAAAAGAIDQLQKDLAENFERSIGGQTLQDGSGKTGDGDEPQGQRGAVEESGLGKSNAEEGGRTPDESLARREQDDGTGQAVQHQDGGQGGSAKARPGEGKSGRPTDPSKQAQAKGGAQPGGRAVPGGDDPADGPLALGNEDGNKKHAGGAGAGSGKATEELLAKKPLTLSGGRQSARFSLTLGGATDKPGTDGPKSIVTQPGSRIAEGQRGAQEADRAVRHEEIPAEYEAVVKRIFKREP